MREALNTLLSEVEKAKELPLNIIADLPTGYGKTKSAPLVFKEIRDKNWASNVIHVLPLRALVSKILDDLVKENEDIIRQAGLSVEDLAYQMGDYLQGYKKEPLFNATYVFSTMDSYVHNLFKVPVTEIFKYHKHYFIPLGRIFTSLLIFDEAHIFVEDKDSYVPSVFLEALTVHNYMRNPVLILSATLPSSYIKMIEERTKNLKRIRIGEEEKVTQNEIVVHDKDFESEVTSIQWVTQIIRICEVEKVAKELADIGLKVLIILDSIEKAINVYKGLKDHYRVGLIHGKMTREDRYEIVNNIDSLNVLIGTSAIEAGIDRSFDALITSVFDVKSLIQRIGRVCRRTKNNKIMCADMTGRIYLIEDFSNKKYVNALKNKRVCWKLPYKKDCDMSYYELIENFSEEKISFNNEVSDTLKRIMSPFFTSADLIRKVLMEYKFSLTRSLLEFYTLGEDEFKNAKGIEDIINNSFVMDFEEALEKWDKIKERVEGIGYYDFQAKKSIVIKEDVSDLKEYYINFIINKSTTPIFILKKGSYIKKEGPVWL